jgi:quercetin dioxygenase-like cupin family protein
MKRVILAVVAVVALAGAAVNLRAQDAAKVDAKHYTVAFENDRVRVLKAHYGPGEKSTMHSHPHAVAVFLTDAKGRFTFPDGKSEDFNGKAGDVIWNTATVHLPENTGDQAFDVIVVELKGKRSAK